VTLDDNLISILCPNGGPGYSGGLTYDTDRTTIAPVGPVVPVPGSLLLVGSGLMSLVACGRRFFSVS
jgi:hypothetical protein